MFPITPERINSRTSRFCAFPRQRVPTSYAQCVTQGTYIVITTLALLKRPVSPCHGVAWRCAEEPIFIGPILNELMNFKYCQNYEYCQIMLYLTASVIKEIMPDVTVTSRNLKQLDMSVLTGGCHIPLPMNFFSYNVLFPMTNVCTNGQTAATIGHKPKLDCFQNTLIEILMQIQIVSVDGCCLENVA
ncbi:hypothetical protein AGLY_008537 [Aphis glycines]|uniref:Uncharacterized protein n=1 Tax=Aphis glycines TaxID=307491 RepID=A0A6G0TL54_APHGL|nr:hypothetical protein AGLY_008537 [Aphis glycines]